MFVRDRIAGTTELVVSGNRSSFSPAISGNGLVVAFASDASNLVSGDDGTDRDVFVRDRSSGVIQRVSINSAGQEADAFSDLPAISDDGRFVAFASLASNLVTGDTNGTTDVFVRDRQAGATERVSVSSSGGQVQGELINPPEIDISGNGRYVAFESFARDLVPDDTNNRYDVFVRDRQTGVTERVSLSASGQEATNDSFDPSLSSDGKQIAFLSFAANLIPTDANGVTDVFVVQLAGGASGADLEVLQTDAPDPAPAGQQVTYTIRVVNHGPQTATGVVLTDTLPAGVTGVVATPSPSSQSGGTLRFNLGSIAVNAERVVTVRVTPGAAGTITNTASVAGVESDPVSGNNQVAEETTVGSTGGGLQLASLTAEPPELTLDVRRSVVIRITVTLTQAPTRTTLIPLTLTGPGTPPRAPVARLVRRQSVTVQISFRPTTAAGSYQVQAAFGGVSKTAAFTILPVPPLELSFIIVESAPAPDAYKVSLTLRRATPGAVTIPVTVTQNGVPVPVGVVVRVPAGQARGSVLVRQRLPFGRYLFSATFGGVTKTWTYDSL